MGNIHAFAHRMTAVSMACLASAGLVLFAVSGFNCSYLAVRAQPDRLLMNALDEELVGETEAFFGVHCDSPFYDDSDRMWNLSQTFLYIGLALGAMTALMAWVLSTCIAPTRNTWRALSILASLSAVMEVPVFLIFESEPCTMDINRQTCSLAWGAYFNIASVVLLVIMALWMQCLKPPNWSKEIEAWRANGFKVNEIEIPTSDTDAESSPRDMDVLGLSMGEEPSPALWAMGSGHKNNEMTEVELGDASESEDVDLESHDLTEGLSALEQATTKEEDEERTAPPGASVVINALREKTQPRPARRAPAACTTTAPTTNGCVSLQSMRRSVFTQQSEFSNETADRPGFKLTIICPDGSREEARFTTPSCMDGEQLLADGQQLLSDTAELVRNASLLGKESNSLASNVGQEVLMDEVDQKSDELNNSTRNKIASRPTMEPEEFTSVPVSSLAVDYGVEGYDNDGVSEMTPGYSVSTAGTSKHYKKQTMSILQDLKQLED